MSSRTLRATVATAVLLSGAAVLTGSSAGAAGSTLDPSFGTAGKVTVPTGTRATVGDLVVRPDGSVIGAGRIMDEANNKSDAFVFRLKPSGAFDANFGIRRLDQSDGDRANALVVRPNGKIVVTGTSSDGYDAFVWQLNPGGSTDGDFGSQGVRNLSSGGQEFGYDIALAPGGKVVVVGQTSVNGGSMVAYRLTAQGDPDTSFDGNGEAFLGGAGSSAYAVVVQGDGKVVVTGSDQNWITASVYRLTEAGQPDLGYGYQGHAGLPYTEDAAWDLALTPSGKVVVVSDSDDNNADEDPRLYRLGTDGKVDATFGGPRGVTFDLGGHEYLGRIAVLPNGGVVAAGDTSLGSDLLVAQFTPAGKPDRAFAPNGVITRGGTPNFADAIAVSPDGKIVLGGDDDRTVWRPLLVRFLGTSKPITCGGKLATIIGTARADRLVGTAGADVIVGLGGNDVVHARGGNDLVCGSAGNDVLYGEAGADALYGGTGTDRLYGGAGRDRVIQ